MAAAPGSRVILLGPPGAGKGTQAERLALSLGVGRVSSGDLFRDHLARGTELGLTVRSYMNSGELVPDDLTTEMVMDWVDGQENRGGFVLDGFPRTLGQAEALGAEMERRGWTCEVLYISVDRGELLRRLSGRLMCRACQRTFHTDSAPPRAEGACDGCGGELYQRDDDSPGAVSNRLSVYEAQTAPLIEYYRRRGVLSEVDGGGSVEAVGRDMLAALGAAGTPVGAAV